MRPPFDADALLTLGQALHSAGYQFTAITPATHARVHARHTQPWARDWRDVFGWSLPFRTGTLLPDLLALMQHAGIVHAHDGGLRASLRAASMGEQLYFHSAYPTSAEDAVFFGPDTYRYVAALRRTLATLAMPERVVDIGTGSGAAAIELALRYPQAQVLGTDINPQALALAAVNRQLAGAANVTLAYSDLLQQIDGEFDLVLSNPPFILDPERRHYRHGGDMLGAALSVQIVEAALARLRPGGHLLLYTGVAIVDGHDAFYTTIRPCLNRACSSWSYEELDPDIFGEQLAEAGYEEVERIAAVWLVAQKA